MKCHHASERMMAIITQPTNKQSPKGIKMLKGRPVNNGDGRYEDKPQTTEVFLKGWARSPWDTSYPI